MWALIKMNTVLIYVMLSHACCYGKKLVTKRDRATERTRQERSKRRARAGDEGERNYKQKSDAK